MINDFRELQDDLNDYATDICIVGCGPVGIALAEAMSAAGRHVLIIEGGGLQVDAQQQTLNEATVAGLPHTGYLDGRARAVGGTGRLWAGQCLRLDPIDFVRRDWLPHSGWPIDDVALAEWYLRAEAFFKISAADYREKPYANASIDPPRWAPDALVDHFTIYTPEIDTGRFHSNCLRKDQSIRVLTHAHVVQIEVNESGGEVSGVRIRDLDGRTAQVRASRVVLCAGGIENARLLLASRERHAQGLGNGRDLVGRFFQEHPNATTASIVGGDSRDLQERFRVLYQGKRRFFPKFALSPHQQRSNRVLNCNAHLVFEYRDGGGLVALRALVNAARRGRLPERPVQQVAALARDASDVGRAVIRRSSGRSPIAKPERIRLQCYVEQSPNPSSRIRLDETTDRLGLPRLCVDWQLSELERRTMAVMTETVAREFARLGFGTVVPDHWLSEAGWETKLRDCSHHIGTTRMAEHPGAGVVDVNGQVFGVVGLYVAGSSVFPTSGYANPTLTAVALAMRLANHLSQPVRVPHVATAAWL